MASFAEDHGPYRFDNNIEWFESSENIPYSTSQISEFLGVEDTNKAKRYIDLRLFLDTTLGKITWHMFCKVAYEYDRKYDVEKIGVDKVVNEVNAKQNSIYANPAIYNVFRETRTTRTPILPDNIGPMFARLFNYYHCMCEERLELFNLRPLQRRENNCPVCGCSFTASGYVTEKPTEDVDVSRWSFKDKVEGGSKVHETKL